MSTPNTPTPNKSVTHLMCAYLLLNDENRARMRRAVIAIGRNDIPALEALKGETPDETHPTINSLIADARKAQEVSA